MASVIEGFLVSLGFKIDKDAYARFNAAVEDAGKRMRGFAVKTVGAATALSAAWMKTSSEISKSYQLSQSTGASIRGISALRLAIKAVGGDAGALDATLQQMSTRLLSMPGYAQQIQAVFGVSMTDATGKTRDMADVLADIAVKMQTMDAASAAAAAQATGLGGVWQQLIDKRFPLELERAKEQTDLLGTSLDETAQSTADLMNAFGAMFEQLKMSTMKFIGEFNKEFDISGTIRKWTKKLPELFDRAKKETVSFFWWGKRTLEEQEKDPITFARKAGEYWDDERRKVGLEDPPGATTQENPRAPLGITTQENSRAPLGATPNTLGFQNKNPGNLRGKDGKFRTFATFEEGFRAMATQVKMYQNAGAKNIRDIISTYAPSNENDTEAYIKSVVDYLRREFNADIDDTTELDLSSSKMLGALVRAMIRQENGAGTDAYFRGASFEREAQAASQAQQKSRVFDASRATPSTPAPVTINQQIYVTGQGAAEKIAATTNDSLEKASVVRNLTRGAT